MVVRNVVGSLILFPHMLSGLLTCSCPRSSHDLIFTSLISVHIVLSSLLWSLFTWSYLLHSIDLYSYYLLHSIDLFSNNLFCLTSLISIHRIFTWSYLLHPLISVHKIFTWSYVLHPLISIQKIVSASVHWSLFT